MAPEDRFSATCKEVFGVILTVASQSCKVLFDDGSKSSVKKSELKPVGKANIKYVVKNVAGDAGTNNGGDGDDIDVIDDGNDENWEEPEESSSGSSEDEEDVEETMVKQVHFLFHNSKNV